MAIQRSLTELLHSKKFRQRQRLTARRQTLRPMRVEPLEDRRLLASDLELVGVQPDGSAFLSNGDTRNVAPTSLRFLFSPNQEIDPNSLGGIRVTRAGGDGAFGDANDVIIQPGYIGIGAAPNEVILRFAQTLPDDQYRIDVLGSGPSRLLNIDGVPFNDGVNERLEFRLDLGPQVVAVVPQPVVVRPDGTLGQNADTIVVYFNNDDLYVPDAQNPSLYQLISTGETVRNLDDVTFLPQSVVYDSVANRAVLTFSHNLTQLPHPVTGLPIGAGTFRLRIGTNEQTPLPPLPIRPNEDVGSSYQMAWDLGALGAQSKLISSSIDAQAFLLDFPGANNEPGHRQIPEEVANGFDNHLNPDFGADSTPGVTTSLYNFKERYGTDTQGQPLSNVITDTQKRRAREALQVWSEYIGVQFLETADLGMTIVTGDPRALDPYAPNVVNHVLKKPQVTGHFIARVDAEYQDSLLILDNALQWNDEFGGDWYQTAMVGIGFLLGLERATDLPSSTLMAFGSDFTYPGAPDAVQATGLVAGTPSPDSFLGNNALSAVNGAYTGLHLRFTAGALAGQSRLIADYTGATRRFLFATPFPSAPDVGNPFEIFEAPEPIFPGNHDILHGLFLHRADSNDIDMYRFTVGDGQSGLFTAEIFAERQPNSSLLDSNLMLFRERSDGSRELIARNDDYFGRDSFIELRLGTGTYYLGVTASGNDTYNAEFDDTGYGGKSQGVYDLRIDFRADLAGENTIRDVRADGSPGVSLDGDANGVPGGVFNFWFRAVEPANLIIVDKLARPFESPIKGKFNNIADALTASRPGDIVRIVPNGGIDGNLSTLQDNFGFEIGPGPLVGQILADGKTLDVPRSVTVMADAGVIFKLNQARIGVGSSSLSVDRSGGVFQALGTPDAPVYFTSYFDESIGLDTYQPTTTPRPGNWGGIVFRNDNDNAEERFNYEREGIFLNHVNYADIRYGGGNVVIESQRQIVTPIQMLEARPTVAFNTIRFSADAPISADPNSFEETSFHAPKYQLRGAFTADYRRVGPDIHGNLLVENSSNGLFIRISTPAGDEQKSLTVPGRFDDTDIVHVLSENLRIEGRSGQPILELTRPPVQAVTVAPVSGGSMELGTYHYKIVNVDGSGFEGRPSEATAPVTLTGANRSVRLDGLPAAGGDFVARRIYRSTQGVAGPYVFVAQINTSDARYIDRASLASLDLGNTLQRDIPTVRGVTLTAVAGAPGTLTPGTYNYRITYVNLLNGSESPSSDPTINRVLAADGRIELRNLTRPNTEGYDTIRIYRSADNGSGPYQLAGEIPATENRFDDLGETLDITLNPISFGVSRARTAARLAIDPGIIVKLAGSRIEATFGSQLIAEGLPGREVIFTSLSDNRYGAGGTFATFGESTAQGPLPGDWGGLYIGPIGSASIDHALLTYGGGVTKIEGTFKAFNILEVHQAELRLTNSVIERNAEGLAGQGPADRFGRGTNEAATIFVRGSQPIIVSNLIQNNVATAITINANSFTSDRLPDVGRSTGHIALTGSFPGNTGPLVRGNRMANNPLNAIDIRGEVLTTRSIWDDTDIVHVLRNQVIVPDFHSNVGLILKSSPTSSLIVKLDGPGDNFDPGRGAGFTATGRQLDIRDRIGGTIQIIGQPDFPVILTSLKDDSVGAGTTPDGRTLTDTNNDGSATLPRPGDWRSIRFDQFANDRNVELIVESESTRSPAPGVNATPATAQFLGELASFEFGGDENLRLGFHVMGVLNEPKDIDVYSFNAAAGTEVWLDIDRTAPTLDTIVELIDSNGIVVARSTNSVAETADPSLLYRGPGMPVHHVNPLQKTAPEFQPLHASGIPKDHFSTNPSDAGMRVVLPGVAGVRSSYHVRVRSAGKDIHDLQGGLTSGTYELQIRLRETDEIPGVTVRYANVRYATNGIELYGLPGHSPLLGEVAEDEDVGGPETNNQVSPSVVPAAGPQDIGNLLASDRAAISIAGNIRTLDDIDFYEMQLAFQATTGSLFQHASVVFDVDYASGLSRPDTIVSVFDSFGRLVLIGRDSNIADDRSGPLDAGRLTDLSRGSLGALDPYIGPVQMPEGTYFVAVTSNARIPTQLLSNPDLRLEPVNTVARVAEDRIGSYGGSGAGDPQVRVLLDQNSIVPVDPDRIPFYVLHDPGNPDESQISVVDLLTGVTTRTIGPYPGKVLDLATRGDGNVFSFSAPDTDPTDANTALFQGVSLVTPQFIAGRDDGIRTYRSSPLNPSVAVLADVGMKFHAVTFGVLDGVERLLAVGTRGDAQNPLPGPTRYTNLLYQFDPRSGRAISAPQADRAGNARLQGAGTQIVERGYLDTSVGGGPGGLIVGLAINDDKLYALSETGGLYLVANPLSNSASLTYIGDVVAPAGVIDEVEPNNSLAGAHDLDQEVWTLRYDPNIGDVNSNTSTSIKHITINGRGDDAFVDFFVRGESGGLLQPTGSVIRGDYLYVASNGTHEILRYNVHTGEFVDVFVSNGSGGLFGPREIVFSPHSGNLLVASVGTNSVLQYDGETGAFLNAFITAGRGGLSAPTGMVFSADNNWLYVASSGNDRVIRYRGTDGQNPFTFVPGNSGGLDNPHGLTFDADGDLYVVSRDTNSILRYSGANGAFREAFVPSGAGGLTAPNLGLRFGPDGHLYASSGGNHQVSRYHRQSGAPLGAYVSTGSDSLTTPWGLLFDSAGNLFVNSLGNHRVLLYNDDVVRDAWQWQSEVKPFSGLAADDRAGTQVAMSGGRLVVGAPLDDTQATDAGAVYVYVRDDAGTPDNLLDDQWLVQQKLFASNAAAGDRFGTAVALDGNLLAVSAVRKGADFVEQGVVYVFRWNGTTWNEEATLVASDAVIGQRLGRELAVNADPFGDTVVASVPVDVVAEGAVTSATPATDTFNGDNNLSDVDDFYNGMYLRFESGALAGQSRLITDYAGNNRTFTFGTPFPAPPATGDLFEILPAERGSAYIFRHDGAAWFEQVKLLPSDSALLDNFGRGLALDAGRLMVGAPHANAGIGSVYLFARDDRGTTNPTDDAWREITQVTPREGAVNDKFGWSVALQGDRAVIGALRDDVGALNSGSAFVFEYSASVDLWEEVAQLSAPDPGANDRFGASVGLDGFTIVVGTPDGDMGVTNSGSAYIFQLDDRGSADTADDVWRMVAEVSANQAASANAFGTSVAIEGRHIAVGDPEWDFRGIDAGSVQMFVFEKLAHATFETFVVPFGTGGLSEPQHMTVGPDGLLYVVSVTSDRILRFDATTGAFVDVFIQAGTSGLDRPQSLAFGPDSTGDGISEVFVTSRGTDEVLRFDGATGAFIDVFASFGLEQPTGLAFGPDRNGDGVQELYVAGFASNNVVVFNGLTGAFQRQFIPPGQGGLAGPMHMEFRPDGRLYIASSGNNSIRRYNAQTGALVSVFVAPGSGGLASPRYFVFGPDANDDGDPELYVSSFNNNSVLRYNGRTGAFVDAFVYSGNEGLAGPTGVTFIPDGSLLVADSVNSTIMRFDTSGTPTFDFFKFTVENAGDRGIFDIDFGWVDGDPGSFDAMIFVLDAAGNVVASNDDADITWGAGGSEDVRDPFLEFVFENPGVYYVMIGEFNSSVAGGVGQGNRPDLRDTYTLHVSVENYQGSSFAGMMLNMRPHEQFADTLFAINRTGSVFAIATDDVVVNPVPFFPGDRTRIATGIDDVLGVTMSTGSLWHITDARREDSGHGLANVFDDSNGNASVVREREPNNTLSTAHDLEDEFWHLGYDSNIGDASEPPINTSLTIPHVTVHGAGDGTRDFYMFRVTAPNSRGIFDIDMDFDEQLDPNGYMDAELSLYDQYGNLLAFMEDATLPTDGDGGKALLYDPPLEPYLEYIFAEPGTYILEVTKRVGAQILLPPDEGDFYTLQVSIENHPVQGPKLDGGLSFFFGSSLTGDVTNAVAAEPVLITSPRHGLLGGERVYVQGILGIPDANGTFTVSVVDEDNFELDDTDEVFGTYLGGGVWRLLQLPEEAKGDLLTNPFSLRGYSAEDKPVLYFNYYLDVVPGADVHQVSVSIVEGDGEPQPLAVKDGGLTNLAGGEPTWRQARIELDAYANRENLRLLFSFDSVQSVANSVEGFFIDDIIIGFAERGEMVSFARNDPTFSINPNANQTTDALTGPYQLEIRTASPFGYSQRPVAGTPNSLQLTRAIDTNERLARQTTIVPPDASEIADGQTFTISDGRNTLVFEFDNDDDVLEGHIAVPFEVGDTAYELAAAIRDAVNSPAAQAVLQVTASTSAATIRGSHFADGSEPTEPLYQLVNLFGTAIVSGIRTVMHDGFGDSNRFRDQGQVLIHSNFISDSRDFGIVATGGTRDKEPGVPVGFLQPHWGAARNLRELNNQPDGGLFAGVVIENNVIVGEGLGGIHVGGSFAPFEIVPPTDTPALFSGQFIRDGQTMTIHAFRTTVTFEFEDISGGPVPAGGSGVPGGNGWAEGNIPIFYRQSAGNWLTPPRAIPPRPYNQIEMAITIRDAIQSSILVTNGTTLHVDANVFDSRWQRDPFTGLPLWAAYVDNATSVQAPPAIAVRRVPLGAAAQPFHRVLNNTIYGNDGNSSFFAGSGFDESNDTMGTAVETYQGRQHHPEYYIGLGTIGDSREVSEPSMDVDFYRFQMQTGDRVTIEMGTNSSVLVNDPGLDSPSVGFTQSETSMLVFGNRVLVGYNDSGSQAAGQKFTGYSLSLDGGLTFTDMGTLPTNGNGDAGDPVLARDETTGTIYFATLTATQGPVHVFRSFNNGDSFTAPVVATPGKVGFQDKPWMTVDNFPGTGRGNVYVTATDFGPGNGIYLFRSTNGGNSFGPSGGTLIASGAVQGSWTTVGRDHTVYVFYHDANTTPQTIKMRRSFDFGATFSAETTVATLATTGANGDLGLTRSSTNPQAFRSNAFPQVVVNPVNGHLYMTYNDNPAGVDKADIYFTSSTNGGVNWSTPVRVNTDTTNNDQWQPTIAVTPNGENVGLFWYDRRLSGTNSMIDYWGRIGSVVDTGVAFRNADFRISEQSFLPVFGTDTLVNPTYMGDYDQAQATNTAFFTVWADNRLGTPDVRFSRVPIAGQQNNVNPVIRLFDNQGRELGMNSGVSASLDYTALASGTYYVGVSGRGNDQYDPRSLGNRLPATSVGDYRIALNVMAPRTWVITAQDGTRIPDGTTFTVSDASGSVTYEFDDVNAPGVTAGNVRIVYNSAPVGQPNRGPGYRAPDVAVAMAEVIGQGLTGVSAVALGGFQGASGALPTQPPAISGDTSFWGIPGFGHDTPLTPVNSTGELYVVVSGATRITGSLQMRPMLTNNIDQLLPETGILVSQRAAPTLLNNVLANLNAGIWQDSSPNTVVGGSLYQHNAVADSNVGSTGDDFNIHLSGYEPLFVNAAARNFYPARKSRVIDSAIDSLEDRVRYATVKAAVGIPVSPILAPDLDAVGLLRSDDPEVDTPSGQGANVFKDRGALDRADFVGPDAVLMVPQDNDLAGADRDPTPTVVQLAPGVYTEFAIQLVDGLQASAVGEGVGVDDLTVDSSKITLTADGHLLRENVDYLFRYNSVTNTIRLTPTGAAWDNNKVYVITLPNQDRFVVTMPDGGQVDDGELFLITDTTGGTVTFEFESGYSLFVPQTLTLIVPEVGKGPGGVQDGQRFTVATGVAGQTHTFEYDNNVPPNYLPGNIPINISAATTRDEVAQATVNALIAAGIGVVPRNLGNGRIHFGAPASYSVNTSLSSLAQEGRTGVVSDGQTISISDGVRPTVVFEFDSNNVVTPGRVRIPFTLGSTQNDISQAMTTAIAGAPVSLSPTYFGDGHIHLGGTVNHTVDRTGAPNVTRTGQPGVRTSTRLIVPPQAAGVGGIADNQWFSIDNGMGRVEVFEFDNNGATMPGSRPILFTPFSTRDQIANAVISAITLANIGVSPTYLGGGVIALNDTIRHRTDTLHTRLDKTGVPGGVVTVPFLPHESFDATQFSAVILDAIAGSQLTGVSTTFRGDSTYFINGIRTISGLQNFFIGAIRDLVGNNLQPNQATNETKFTILMPDVEYDYGDAPASYGVVFADGGARHVVPETGSRLLLGSGVSTEPDGQPSPRADADDDDGVNLTRSVFNQYLVTPLVVTVTERGYLDAWIDFNGDGDWGDPGEQVFMNLLVNPGENHLTVQTPAFARIGETFARFRVSTLGNLGPNGLALDGEVEDYLIRIEPGIPPVAVDDSGFATDKRTPLTIAQVALLANDSDADTPHYLLSVRPFDTIVSARGATVSFDVDGNLVYDPRTSAELQALDPNQQLVDTFTYQAFDGVLPSNFAVVSVMVSGVNQPPVAMPDAYSTDEDTVLQVVAPGVLGNDYDPDVRDTLTVVEWDSVSQQGALVVVQPDGRFSYDPRNAPQLQSLAVGESLQDTFVYTVSDPWGATSSATVTITVTGVNDRPVANNDFYETDEDTVLDIAAPGVLGNDTDIDGDPLVVVGADATSARGASVSVNADGSLRYDPTAASVLQNLPEGAVLDDSFSYTISDPHGGTSTATVTVRVEGRNDAPIAVDDLYATTEDAVLQIGPAGVLANDFDRDTGDTIQVDVSATDTVSALGAVVSVLANGSFSYDPRMSAQLQDLIPGEMLEDTFVYTIVDSRGAKASATVTVRVSGVNAPPVALDKQFDTDEDTVLTVGAPGVMSGDYDPDGHAIELVRYDAVSVLGAPVVVLPDGTFTYDPRNVAILQALNVGDVRVDSFTYTIRDVNPDSQTATATIYIEVAGRNDAPVAVNDQYLATRNTVLVMNVLGNDYDLDGTLNLASIVVTSAPAHGAATPLADGTIRYTPATSYFGNDQLKYRVRDNSGALSNEATVLIRVNSPPTAVDDSVQTFRDEPVIVSVLSNDFDPDGTLAVNTVGIVNGPAQGTVQVHANGTVTYRPRFGFVGTDSFTYTVRDNDGATSNLATVSIAVIIDPYPWHNPKISLDVNNDGFVSAIDALIVINDLNFRGPRQLPNPPIPPLTPPPYLDVSRDNQVSAIDALLVINYLNSRQGNGEGEGEGEGERDPVAPLAGLGQIGSQSVASSLLVTSLPELVSGADIGARSASAANVTTLRATPEEPDSPVLTGDENERWWDATDDIRVDTTFEDALDDIAQDVSQSLQAGETSQGVAVTELLFGRRRFLASRAR